MSEAELMNAAIEAGRLLGWKVAHFRPAGTRLDLELREEAFMRPEDAE
jgi:hypothetical protein